MSKPPPAWKPADATRKINQSARAGLTLGLTFHAKARMAERDLIVGDLAHLLKTGFMFEPPEPAANALFKYCVEGTPPNSDGRTVRAVVIPSGNRELKIVTVMWRDER